LFVKAGRTREKRSGNSCPKKGQGLAIFMQSFMRLCKDIALDLKLMDVSEVEGWLPHNQPQKVIDLLL
jgi:hypothetical protein